MFTLGHSLVFILIKKILIIAALFLNTAYGQITQQKQVLWISTSLNEKPQITTLAGLEAMTAPITGLYYITTDAGKYGIWWYDAKDITSSDNGGTIKVSSNGKRFKRIIQDNIVLASWFLDSLPGTTLQTEKFQAAINAAQYKKLVLPSNYTFYTEQVNLVSYTHIIGDKTIIKTPSSSPLGSRLVQASTVSRVILNNIEFDLSNVTLGNENNGTCPVAFEAGCSYITIKNLYIHNSHFVAIKIVGSSFVDVSYNRIYNTDAGIHLLDEGLFTCRNVYIHHNNIDGTTTPGENTSEGISISPQVQNVRFKKIRVTDNFVKNKTESQGISFFGVEDGLVEGNIIVNCLEGIAISLRDEVPKSQPYEPHSKKVFVINNRIISALNFGIRGQADDALISGNIIDNTGGTAISTARGYGKPSTTLLSERMTISKNIINKIGRAGTGGNGGIQITNLNNSKILDNQIRTNKSTASFYGIRWSGKYGTGNIIKRNTCDWIFSWVETAGTQDFSSFNEVSENTFHSLSNFRPDYSLTNAWKIKNNTLTIRRSTSTLKKAKKIPDNSPNRSAKAVKRTGN
ncbi:MAG: hypothetical protein ACR2KX_20425 [Chitinophagaceae bacterium]